MEQVISTNTCDPHVLVEIVHQSNCKFLRYSGNTNASSNTGTTMPISVLDTEMNKAGSLLTHLSLDSIMIQALFHNEILTFWEILLGIHSSNASQNPSHSASADTGSDEQTKSSFFEEGLLDRQAVEVEAPRDTHRPRDDGNTNTTGRKERAESKVYPNSDDDEEEEEEEEDPPKPLFSHISFDTRTYNPSRKKKKRKTHIDKVKLPKIYVGQPFTNLFLDLYRRYQVIVIAVSRKRTPKGNKGNNKGITTTIVAPAVKELFMHASDELFVVTP